MKIVMFLFGATLLNLFAGESGRKDAKAVMENAE